MATDQSSELSIVICTFRREELLRRAIASIARQTCPDGIVPVLVIVDNSDDGSAAGAVEASRASCPYNIIYRQAHPANIAVARNAGIRATTAPFVAFIDDDAEAMDGWLSAVCRGLQELPHDILFGAIQANFEDPNTMTAITKGVYSLQLNLPRGADLFAAGAHKTPGVALPTNNCILRRATTLVDEVPFDPTFGSGGGEDYDLFCRLQLRGCRLGWLPDAIVCENVPPARCNPAYLRRRLIAGGQAFALAAAKNSARPTATRWWIRAVAAVQAVVLTAALPLRILQRRQALLEYSYALAGVLGKLSFGGIRPIYREFEPHTAAERHSARARLPDSDAA